MTYKMLAPDEPDPTQQQFLAYARSLRIPVIVHRQDLAACLAAGIPASTIQPGGPQPGTIWIEVSA